MRLEAQRFYSFLLLAAFLSAVSYFAIFNTANPRLEPFDGPEQWMHAQKRRYAYATFLGPPTSPTNNASADTDADANAFLDDPYFTSVRLLNYQIQYAEKTRTRLENTPFIVAYLPSVPQSQLEVLQNEGAVLVRITPLDLPSAFNKEFVENSRFRDVLAKLRVWQLVDWEKVLYIDADSFLLQNLDGLFEDPEMSPEQHTLPLNSSNAGEGHGKEGQSEPEPPARYLMAASTDTYGDQTPWEEPGHVNYLCACFMLFEPSMELFDYYMSILSLDEPPPALQDAYYPDQDLLIYAHRNEGRMPWRRIPITWSANDGEMNDEYALKGGVKSLHVKGWEGAEGGNVASEKYKELWRELVKEMKNFWRKMAESGA